MPRPAALVPLAALAALGCRLRPILMTSGRPRRLEPVAAAENEGEPRRAGAALREAR